MNPLQLEKIAAFAQQIHAGNGDGHGFDHIERVVALAKRILATEPAADANLVVATCYLHDTYDEKITADVATQKAAVAQFLTEIAVSTDEIAAIFDIIDKMSFSSNLAQKQSLSLNGQIVQDADRLDAMGAWGIARALEYGFARNRQLYDPAVKPVATHDKASYHAAQGTTVNHFYEKLFLLKDLLNRPESQRIGAERDQIMHAFVAAIEKEYAESH